MYKKKDIFIILILFIVIAGAVSFWIFFRESFTIGNTKALIDNDKKIIFVTLPPDSLANQKVSYNFPFKRNIQVFIKNLSNGSNIIDNPIEEKLENGLPYNFGSFISHSKIIIRSETDENEYDLWVTTGDIPILTIQTRNDIKDEPKIDCDIGLISAVKSYSIKGINAAIELVDNSRLIPKESYSLNIIEDPLNGNIPSILDFEASKRFRLSASYFDRSFIREKLSYDLFKTLSKENISPESRYVEVFLNGNYQGLYLLSRRVDRNIFSLSNYDQDDKDHSVIYEATGWRADFTRGIEGFSQIEPDYEKDKPYFEPLEKLIKLTTETSDAEFFDSAEDFFDINNIVDNHILFLLTGSSNERASFQYIFKEGESDARFKFSPGSFLIESFGRKENSFKTNSINSFYGSKLYNRLYENNKYRERLKKRWNELREDTLILDNIYRLIDQNAELIYPAQFRDSNRWPINPEIYSDDFSFLEDIKYIKDYLEKRMDFLDKYLNNPPFFKIGNTFANINEETGTIFCTIPLGEETLQKIETNIEGDIYIEPISRGIYDINNMDNSKTYYEFEPLYNKGVQTDNILITIENTAENELINSTETISGWALNQNSKTGTGVENIFIFDGPNLDAESYLGKAHYGSYKEGTAEYFKNTNFSNSGFSLEINTIFLKNGYHNFYIYAFDKNGNFSLKILPVVVDNDLNKADGSSNLMIGKDNKYDFIDYIFHGKLSFVNEDTKKVYDLYVTTGNVPIIVINTNNTPIPDYPKIDCQVQLLSSINMPNFNTDKIDSVIEVRGGSGIFSEKKSYNFEFKRELSHDLELKLLDMTNARKWILNSCFLDRSLMRDKLSYDLFNQLRDSKHYDYAPQTRFVEVFLNDSYRGLYLLTERIDEDLLELNDYNDEDEMHSVVYKATSFATDWRRWNSGIVAINPYKGATRIDSGTPYDKLTEHQGYLQKEPNPLNEDHGNFWGPLLHLRELSLKSNEAYFSTNIENELDLNNTIDFHLLILITGNYDGRRNNQYLCRDNNEESKFFFVPWDYNATFGRAVRTGKEPYTEWYSNDLFDRLLKIESYRERLIKRWNDLKGNVFSQENIISMVEINSEIIRDAQKRNFDKYPIVVGEDWLNDQYKDDDDFYDDISFAKTWIKGRISFLDNYINNGLNIDYFEEEN
jgi:spore coat protein CotH